ncbi:MAG: biopolymer transporter ExbD [Pseudomonadota bacterium]
MKLRRPSQEPLELNLTPLIDCLLFLIIFFMLSTTFAKTGKLQIQLPQADAGASKPVGKALEVAVDSRGHYAINGQVLASAKAEDLRAAIESAAGTQRDQPFVISADGQAPHQAVVTVMDVAGQLGFRSLGIGTRDAKPPSN